MTTDASPPPIFIAGCGRSGTTYLRAVVAAHPDLFIPTESLFIATYLTRGHVLPRGLRTWLFNREPQLRSWYHGPPLPTDDMAATVRDAHLYAARQENRRVWGQKTPRFVRNIDAFRRAWPGARFILIYRDPRGVAASMLNSPRHPFDVTWAARRWVRDNAPVVQHLRDPKPDVMLVKYEDLILHFHEHLPRLFDFIGISRLSHEEVVREGKVAQFTVGGFDVAANNVRDGLEPQPKTIEAWKRTLSEGQCREVERICMPLMRELGYQPLPPGATGLRVRAMEPIRLKLDRLGNLGVVWHYARYWPAYLFHTILRTAAIKSFGLLRRGGEPDGGKAAPESGRAAVPTPPRQEVAR